MSAAAVDHHVAWHDAECGSYMADLPLWERLAGERGGPVLDLGAGAGRVALHLARFGHDVVAVDSDRRLLEALRRRAAADRLTVEVVHADCRSLSLDPERRIALAIAPMQLLHLLGGPEGRGAALRAVAAHLVAGGIFAAAVLDGGVEIESGAASPPLPDVREVDGWVHSSLPLEVRADEGALEVSRLRQLVSPGGGLSEERHAITLDRLSAEELQQEAAAAGLSLVERAPIAETPEHVASTALVWERTDG